MRRLWAGRVVAGLLLLAAGCRSTPGGTGDAQDAAGLATAAPREAAPSAGAEPAPSLPSDAARPRPGRPGAEVRPPGDTPAASPGRCTRDADCALLYTAEEGCCPTLCTPRAVPVAEARRKEQACQGTSTDTCPMPMCAPPRGVPAAACVQGACSVRLDSND